MRPPVALVALLVSVSSLALAPAASGQVVRIPGTSVAMTPPEGFRVARGSSALENPETGSSISIAELPPDGYDKLVAVFASPKTASAGFAGQGIKIARIEQLAIDQSQVPLAIGDQAENGKVLKKYIAVMGGPKTGSNTVMITFNLAGRAPLSQTDVEAALRSVKLTRLVPVEEKLAQLPFKFDIVAPFHATDVASGTAMLSSADGPDPSGAKPMILIGRGSTSAGPKEMAQTAESMLRKMAGFAAATFMEQKPVTFAGGEGYFIAAAADGRTMLQFLRVMSNGTYIRLVARGEAAELEGVRAAVTEIADSVTAAN